MLRKVSLKRAQATKADQECVRAPIPSPSPAYSRLPISSPRLPTLSVKCLWWFLAVLPRDSEGISALITKERSKKDTGSERGVGEGDISG